VSGPTTPLLNRCALSSPPWPQLTGSAMNGNQPPPPPKDYYLGFNYAVDRQSAANLVALVQQAVALRATSVTICITSNGGAPDQALYVYEILCALNVPVNTHAIGTVQSAAMIIFMAGERRTASPGTNFLFHDTVFNPAAGAPLRYDDLLGHASAIDHNDKWAHQLIANELNRPIEEVAEWFFGQNTRDTDFALANGIIDNVQPLLVPPPAEFCQVGYKF
jgi:ATP-dependent protease ClpP protease subunit